MAGERPSVDEDDRGGHDRTGDEDGADPTHHVRYRRPDQPAGEVAVGTVTKTAATRKPTATPVTPHARPERTATIVLPLWSRA